MWLLGALGPFPCQSPAAEAIVGGSDVSPAEAAKVGEGMGQEGQGHQCCWLPIVAASGRQQPGNGQEPRREAMMELIEFGNSIRASGETRRGRLVLPGTPTSPFFSPRTPPLPIPG